MRKCVLGRRNGWRMGEALVRSGGEVLVSGGGGGGVFSLG